ncbi:ethylene-responsive nuclear protein/ethylene-regulated nuclear protein (ERT2) [Abeliophyllum distichum]|uniref:Ethylene-responsive nuclear protein/ethylene-regulated nuclear protein (ERT2) n=1 Tax=Abeliophyllum distichum TaxID=126358 RepID=A0ABD1PVN8_9LAMI
MPFPWKKTKSSRISQLVNDHLQKRQGDSSLVVETGFPTSLVDFAIKNGDKLKKQSKKKREKPPLIPLENEHNDPVILQSSDILPSPSFTPSSSPSRCPLPSCSLLHPKTRDFDEVAVGANESGVGRRVVCANGVAVAVVKVVLVVVFALGMKKFVVGITISAFLLIFLEYVGKNACGILNPCSDAQRRLRMIVQRIQRFFRFKEDNSDQNNENCFDPGCSGFKKCESMSSFQETESYGTRLWGERDNGRAHLQRENGMSRNRLKEGGNGG